MRTKENHILRGAPTFGHQAFSEKDLPQPRDIEELANGRFVGRLESLLMSNGFRKAARGAAVFGGAGVALGGAAHISDIVKEVTKNVPGVHRNIDAGKLVSGLGLGIDSAHAGDPNPNYIPAENPPVVPPTGPEPVAPLPGLSPAENRRHATPPPTETPEPTPKPTKTPEPTPTKTPEPTPTATPKPPEEGQLKIVKFHDRDGNAVRTQGEEGLIWGFRVDGPGANDFSTQTKGDGTVIHTVEPGVYDVCEEQRPGWTATVANCIKTFVNPRSLVEAIFGNKQIEPPPPTAVPPAPQPPVEQKVKFVPQPVAPEIPKVCTLPDGTVVDLPAEFQAKLFGKDAKTIAAMLEEFKCEHLAHVQQNTLEHQGIQSAIDKHTTESNEQHEEQKKDHKTIIDFLEDFKDDGMKLARGFWDWADTVGIYGGALGLAGLILWRTRRRDQQPPVALAQPVQPDGGQPQPPQPDQRRRFLGFIPVPRTRRPAVPVAPEPQPDQPQAHPEPEAQPGPQQMQEENINTLANVWFELLNAITDEQLQAVADRFTPEQLDHVRAVLHRFGVANAMDLVPLTVMRVTRDTINALPEEQRQAIQQRAEEIAEQRRQAQGQPAPEPVAPAVVIPQEPVVPEPAPAPQPVPERPQPVEQVARGFNSVTLEHGRIWVGRMVVDPQTGPVLVRGIIGRRGNYLFEIQGNQERRPRTVDQATMDNWILAEQPQAGQPADQAGQVPAQA